MADPVEVLSSAPSVTDVARWIVIGGVRDPLQEVDRWTMSFIEKSFNFAAKEYRKKDPYASTLEETPNELRRYELLSVLRERCSMGGSERVLHETAAQILEPDSFINRLLSDEREITALLHDVLGLRREELIRNADQLKLGLVYRPHQLRVAHIEEELPELEQTFQNYGQLQELLRERIASVG